MPAVVPWVLVMALYFVPYALIVGELGATFKEAGGEVGPLFRIIYAITQGTCFLAALIISIDAPLRVLLDNADTNYIPKGLLRKTKRGAYRNGLILVVVIVPIVLVCLGFVMMAIARKQNNK